MKIIKKSDKLTLKKMMEIQHAEDQNLQADTVNSSAPVVDEQPAAIPVENHLGQLIGKTSL